MNSVNLSALPVLAFISLSATRDLFTLVLVAVMWVAYIGGVLTEPKEGPR
jgi:hypothetical protein